MAQSLLTPTLCQDLDAQNPLKPVVGLRTDAWFYGFQYIIHHVMIYRPASAVPTTRPTAIRAIAAVHDIAELSCSHQNSKFKTAIPHHASPPKCV